jgi:hypothetical protein
MLYGIKSHTLHKGLWCQSTKKRALQKHPVSVTLVTLLVRKINENAIEVYKHIGFKELSPVVKKEFTKSLEYSAEKYTAMAKLRTKYFEEIGGDLENIQHMLLVLLGYHAVRLKVQKKKIQFTRKSLLLLSCSTISADRQQVN